MKTNEITAIYYRWGEYQRTETIDFLDEMEELDDVDKLTLDIRIEDRALKFYADESDIDRNEDGISIKNAYGIII